MGEARPTARCQAQPETSIPNLMPWDLLGLGGRVGRAKKLKHINCLGGPVEKCCQQVCPYQINRQVQTLCPEQGFALSAAGAADMSRGWNVSNACGGQGGVCLSVRVFAPRLQYFKRPPPMPPGVFNLLGKCLQRFHVKVLVHLVAATLGATSVFRARLQPALTRRALRLPVAKPGYSSFA
jgi:hypothetical protein